MAWIRELIRDPLLRDDWEWYPYRNYIYEDGKEVRFYDEPLSADDAWDARVCQFLTPFSLVCQTDCFSRPIWTWVRSTWI